MVWQLDDQLRQDTIQPPRWEPYRSDTCDALVFAAGTVEPVPHVTCGGQTGSATGASAIPAVSLELAEVWPPMTGAASGHTET